MHKEQAVNSSIINLVEYDDLPDHILTVHFASGAVYQYEGVPYWAYVRMITAPSIGSFFHKEIRNSYHYNKIG
jgi:hypothetical protein